MYHIKMEKIKELEAELRYENQEGIHTYHLCKCGRRGCRTRCQLCIEEELKGEKNGNKNI